MSINVIYLSRLQSRLREGDSHRSYTTLTPLRWLCNVVSIIGSTISHNFRQDRGTPLHCKGKAFHNEYRCPLPHNKAIPLRIKRSRCLQRLLVFCRKGSCCIKASNAQRCDCRLSPPRNHRLGSTAPNNIEGLTNCIGAAGTGRRNTEIGALRA